MMKLNRSVPSIAAELLIVIVGILMAISIDSWWTQVGDRRAERELLASLSGEVAKNQELLERQFDFYGSRTKAAETLLRLGPQAADLPADSLAALWKWITRGGSYDPSTGVLDAAVTSGTVTLIRDPAIRVALAGWPGTVANLSEVERIVNTLLFDQLVPWLRQQTALPGESFGELGIPAARLATDYEFLSSNLVMENFLREIVAWGRILVDNRRELDETIDLIQSGIRRSRSEGG
jgi:hypothetical protein